MAENAENSAMAAGLPLYLIDLIHGGKVSKKDWPNKECNLTRAQILFCSALSPTAPPILAKENNRSIKKEKALRPSPSHIVRNMSYFIA
jgi:hypothetical protein